MGGCMNLIVYNLLLRSQMANPLGNNSAVRVIPYSLSTTINFAGFGRLLINQIRHTRMPTRAIIKTFDVPIIST